MKRLMLIARTISLMLLNAHSHIVSAANEGNHTLLFDSGREGYGARPLLFRVDVQFRCSLEPKPHIVTTHLRIGVVFEGSSVMEYPVVVHKQHLPR